MTSEHLLDAIENIDDAFIEEAERSTVLLPKVWIPAAAVAACALLSIALLPWDIILWKNDPSGTDTLQNDPSSNILQYEDTTFLDSTNENEYPGINYPMESTQPSTEATVPDKNQNNIQSTDTFDSTPSDSTFIPPVILPPVTDDFNTNAPDTTGPNTNVPELPEQEEGTTSYEKETTGPEIPDDSVFPDHGITLPQRPSVLSYPKYPAQDQYPQVAGLRNKWRIEKDERINRYQSGIGNTDSFMSLTTREFFSNAEDENLIYSPINAYMTLGMLTEAASGNSRTQLLDLLGENDILSLRSSANNLWNACYRDDGIVTSVLASSMWLDNSFAPNTAVTDILAENYYASSFSGNMGDEEYDALMRSWVNEQTRGALSNTVSENTLDPESMMSLMSTVYFKAQWEVEFDPQVTRTRVFHSSEGDVTAQFMYRDFIGFYYKGENFKTTCLDLKEGGAMWFILPDSDVSLNSLFSDSEAMGFISGQSQKTMDVNDNSAYMWLFLPKFDINSQIDLLNTMKNVGVTDVFEADKADFSALTSSNVFVNSSIQSARVSIDEGGCEAASANGGIVPGNGADQPYGFVLDRPFIFVVTSDTGIPLFVGTVNTPN